MPNLLRFVDWLTMESLRILVNKAQIAPFFNTDYNKEYTQEFAVGETVRVKLPQRFLIRTGLGYVPQPITRKYTTVTMDKVIGVDFEWDSVEKALRMERGEEAIRREYIEPAMNQIANELDSQCSLWAYQNTNNVVGALGTTPTTNAVYLAARTRLNENSCPPGERGLIVSPAMQAAIANANVAVFNPQAEISKQYKEGSMGRAFGFDWYESNNLYDHTCGTMAVANSHVHAAVLSGASSMLVHVPNGETLRKGDVFTIDSVFNVNPVNRRSTGVLKQFVVTQDFTSTATPATDTLYFSPSIEGPGSQYQNVDSLPAANDVLVTFPGTVTPAGLHGIQGLALHKDAFALVGVKMETPKAVELASQTRDPATGISVRFVRMFDPITSKMVNRFDCLFGFGNLYPDNCAVRVASLN